MSVTLKIINNFNSAVTNGTDYFGSHYSDDQVWLFFLNTSGKVKYTPVGATKAIAAADSTGIQLSTVKDGTFTLETVEDSTKLFAGLGTTDPFTLTNGPGLFQADVPYAVAEWTIKGDQYDNVDITYIDSFSFPTVATITDSGGTQTGKCGFRAGTTAEDIMTAFKTLIATHPMGPDSSQKPTSGVGFGPEVPTVSGSTSKYRWVGSSKFWVSGPVNKKRGMYTYAPSFHNYLKYLQDNEPTTKTTGGSIKGWYIDYSGNNGYSGYLSITGSESAGYGLEVHDIRVNTTPSAANDWAADPNAGTSITGKITVAANNSSVDHDYTPGTTDQVLGLWTDAVIYSGAALIGTLGGGPVVTGTHDLAEGKSQNVIVGTFLASISASITTGLLGSKMYLDAYTGKNPKSTMYWFNTMTRAESMTKLFGNAWSGTAYAFYDPYWAVLAGATDNQGYLSPFNDRWSNFSPDKGLSAGDTIQWELGLTKSS